jgi:hypothetical protein
MRWQGYASTSILCASRNQFRKPQDQRGPRRRSQGSRKAWLLRFVCDIASTCAAAFGLQGHPANGNCAAAAGRRAPCGRTWGRDTVSVAWVLRLKKKGALLAPCSATLPCTPLRVQATPHSNAACKCQRSHTRIGRFLHLFRGCL